MLGAHELVQGGLVVLPGAGAVQVELEGQIDGTLLGPAVSAVDRHQEVIKRSLKIEGPTAGIDIGAKGEIYQLVTALTASGAAVGWASRGPARRLGGSGPRTSPVNGDGGNGRRAA